MITYLTLGLCLFPEDDYEEVATKVTGSLDRWGCWNAAWTAPTASAITQARKRLGRAVFPELFERTCGPVAGDPSPVAGAAALGTARGSWLRGWRLLAIDGFEVDVPDTEANAAEFGYAGSGANRSALPKARVVALAECGTHAFVAAEVDAYRVGEKTFTLPPRYTRTHEQCRPTEVTFELPAGGKKEERALKAEDGSRFVLTKDGDAVRVKKE